MLLRLINEPVPCKRQHVKKGQPELNTPRFVQQTYCPCLCWRCPCPGCPCRPPRSHRLRPSPRYPPPLGLCTRMTNQYKITNCSKSSRHIKNQFSYISVYICAWSLDKCLNRLDTDPGYPLRTPEGTNSGTSGLRSCEARGQLSGSCLARICKGQGEHLNYCTECCSVCGTKKCQQRKFNLCGFLSKTGNSEPKRISWESQGDSM